MRGRFAAWVAGICLVAVSGVALAKRHPDAAGIALESVVRNVRGGYTIADRLASFGEPAASRLAPGFAGAGVPYPPAETAWLAFKEERRLEVWARAEGGPWRRVREYAILGASGRSGPKLREGDLQVPEGTYRVELLNPNSLYHVSMRLDYPNAFDRRMAARDGRTNLGGDIMIHGKSGSVGCLAMGDETAEELFTLAAAVGIERITVLVAPRDLRQAPPGWVPDGAPRWTADLYATLRAALAQYR